jgi:hypothetical protein
MNFTDNNKKHYLDLNSFFSKNDILITLKK